jgi:hypothetical protein
MRHKPYAYAYYAEIYCAPCGNELPATDPENNEKRPIYSWELNDLAAEGLDNCGECGTTSREWRPA